MNTQADPPNEYSKKSKMILKELCLRVNDIMWHETDSLYGKEATDEIFITRTDEDGKTAVIFGDGQEGARLPEGDLEICLRYHICGKTINVIEIHPKLKETMRDFNGYD